MITGSEDGYIRGVSIGPNKILNYLGNHSESDEIEPITRLAVSNDLRFVASLSYDNWIKFHNISTFVDGRKSFQGEAEDGEEADSDMEEDSDDEDEEGGNKKQPKMPKKVNLETRKREIQKQKKKDFFSDI